jgi:hypothetical protein
MKFVVLSAVHFTAEGTLSTTRNCFAKCAFPGVHFYSSDDNVLKLTEDEENEWQSLHPLR